MNETPKRRGRPGPGAPRGFRHPPAGGEARTGDRFGVSRPSDLRSPAAHTGARPPCGEADGHRGHTQSEAALHPVWMTLEAPLSLTVPGL
ncbi:hypothetical protein Pve01_00080 [Planomonospora venezuelensis]|nr:hypothetical protein Pve01_00080 [Planomonospora venezuelensis]